ncbi:hypothetical protein DFH05DRAFT_1460027 [Lentinula detonsa]|uniref:Uncharacterized protein n=1 Tax=Lentinula detonsa TaxID=2804962 RepID=A0A9W8P252_9AGAR|nr:hypothetical protein DFH05DRAFT_1460027 [Lentinula detonsa]
MRVQIKGVGSGLVEQETGRDGPEESQVPRAKFLTEDLLVVVCAEHAKMAAVVQAQQMELHQVMDLLGGMVRVCSSASTVSWWSSSGFIRAAYGYDLNSAEFKTWAAEQAEQAEQYYAQQQTQGQLFDQQQQGQQVGSGVLGYNLSGGGHVPPPPPPPLDAQAPPPPPPPPAPPSV